MKKSLREIIRTDFEGFERAKMEFWDVDELPCSEWTDNIEHDHVRRFSEGENFEEISLRTWLCTDQYVGFYAVLMDGKLLAFTYQGGRKLHKVWYFVHPDSETKMMLAFLKYYEPSTSEQSPVLDSNDPIFDRDFDSNEKYDWMTGPLDRNARLVL